MVLSVYLEPKFRKCLAELRKQGGTSSLAAKKADDLINGLLLRGRDCSCEIGKLTKNGEFRIKQCKKYDLGNGYRLICLRKEHHFILLYIGTHDECHRWLERNKGLRYEIDDDYKDVLITKEIPAVDATPIKEIDPADKYENQLLQKIDDKILRRIFCGLCSG
jgi:hypothetical protein